MDLSTAGIYASAFQGIRKFPLVYLFLFFWTLVVTIIVAIVVTIGSSIYMGSIMVVSLNENSGSTALYLSMTYVGIILLVTSILLAATKAGFMAFGSAVRKETTPTPLHFFRGIIKYTPPLFIGGLVVGMLTCIPFLAFLALARINLAGVISDVFTSGWNYRQAIGIFNYLWELGQVAALCNVIIFFWLTPWDEMVVLYDIPYPEALAKSFSFVFSKRHFFRVLLLIVVNIILSQLVLLLTNAGAFNTELHNGFGIAWLNVLLGSSQNIATTIIQFVLYPFFIYTQLYLLPWPEKAKAEILPEMADLIRITAPPVA
ncbi:MAG: hypothetical protein NTY09_10260 [bacterium]|nr:hypothetical protein [bacterium]